LLAAAIDGSHKLLRLKFETLYMGFLILASRLCRAGGWRLEAGGWRLEADS
jgi:hypothetical protein